MCILPTVKILLTFGDGEVQAIFSAVRFYFAELELYSNYKTLGMCQPQKYSFCLPKKQAMFPLKAGLCLSSLKGPFYKTA